MKPRDYEPGVELESASPYALWKELQDVANAHSERALAPGDLLETIVAEGSGPLLIAKYIGFEPAEWIVPELKTAAVSADNTHTAEVLNAERELHGR